VAKQLRVVGAADEPCVAIRIARVVAGATIASVGRAIVSIAGKRDAAQVVDGKRPAYESTPTALMTRFAESSLRGIRN
jgi:hypothetical protein